MVVCEAVLECLKRSSELRNGAAGGVPPPVAKPSRKSKIWMDEPRIIEQATGPQRGLIRRMMAGVTCDLDG